MEYKHPLIIVEKLKKQFISGHQIIKAVDDVSFSIFSGETLGLVGESGCGKSTTGRLLLRLDEPTAGNVFFDQCNILNLSPKELKRQRQKMQLIFQDPYASLNPRMTANDIIAEPFEIHRLAKGLERKKNVEKLFELVGLDPSCGSRFPHEFSGGQKQRIGIARALAVNPRFIVCDEPISALDVSVQAQIVNLLKKLQNELGLTYLFIAHDLSMVKYISDRVAVMYMGHIVELSPSQELYDHPLHPYTKALLSAIPIPDPQIERKRIRTVLKGEIPSIQQLEHGCVFASRCPLAQGICSTVKPEWKEIRAGHFTACHFANNGPLE